MQFSDLVIQEYKILWVFDRLYISIYMKTYYAGKITYLLEMLQYGAIVSCML